MPCKFCDFILFSQRLFAFIEYSIPRNLSSLTISTADKRENVEELRERMRHFEEEWQIPVLKIANVDGPLLPDGRSFDGRAGVKVLICFSILVVKSRQALCILAIMLS